MAAVFVEVGAATILLTWLALSVRQDTWMWDITKGGNSVMWLMPIVIVGAIWLALKERRLWIKRFSIIFHLLFVLAVAVVIAVNWIAPFPD